MGARSSPSTQDSIIACPAPFCNGGTPPFRRRGEGRPRGLRVSKFLKPAGCCKRGKCDNYVTICAEYRKNLIFGLKKFYKYFRLEDLTLFSERDMVNISKIGEVLV
jgi:hypothetical protein